ncbi:hypothetical protein NA57DRAFT_78897 [Rhizodiscina lignyota]|uniref:Uncharacterized protein n=1 Tax=Rhizodiscina lignyota TaxID=1504668 RepID=A0A9P4IC00_9PEZI|nr:hypothetical protein NA57DRAFT_78897 [Rhizodiscina lignyota]
MSDGLSIAIFVIVLTQIYLSGYFLFLAQSELKRHEKDRRDREHWPRVNMQPDVQLSEDYGARYYNRVAQACEQPVARAARNEAIDGNPLCVKLERIRIHLAQEQERAHLHLRTVLRDVDEVLNWYRALCRIDDTRLPGTSFPNDSIRQSCCQSTYLYSNSSDQETQKEEERDPQRSQGKEFDIDEQAGQ